MTTSILNTSGSFNFYCATGCSWRVAPDILRYWSMGWKRYYFEFIAIIGDWISAPTYFIIIFAKLDINRLKQQ